MTKAGIVPAKFHRRPQNGWKLKRVTVEKTRTGKYYGCILYAYPSGTAAPPPPAPENTVGLKYSIPHFYVSDDGRMADPPHWMRQSREKLTKLQRRLSRMQPGSRNYEEAVRKYRLLHEHIANQRKDFIHKESRRIANAWDAVCVRSEALTETVKQTPWAGAADSGFGMFRECLRYKLERQGKPLILVDRYFPSTRTCSVCGLTQDDIRYRKTTWVCPKCGTVHNREINAARNIKAQGLKQYLSA